MRRALVGLACLLALGGCGDDSTLSSGGGEKPRLIVSAASSLKDALTSCARDYGDEGGIKRRT